jgi:hypothetical protein
MSTQIQSMAHVTKRATNALIKDIGIVDTLRFLSQFRTGTGDYTVERRKMFQGMSVNDIISEIKKQQEQDDV